MRLILILFLGTLTLTGCNSKQVKQSQKLPDVMFVYCKLSVNVCGIAGHHKGVKFKGTVQRTKKGFEPDIAPKSKTEMVMAILTTGHTDKAHKACAMYGLVCKFRIERPVSVPSVKPQVGPADPAPNPVVETGIQLTIRKPEEDCV